MRKRFKKEETYVKGQEIQWRNGSHWHPGKVLGDRQTDQLGYQYYPVENQAETRTLSKGQLIHAYADALRAVEPALTQ